MLWECVDNNPVDRLVIDMRHNGGGDYTQGREHLVYEAQRRQSVNRAGRLFVVTGRATFSAAMTNATDFRRETEALLVGEPPGATQRLSRAVAVYAAELESRSELLDVALQIPGRGRALRDA
jgi:hypothetical protein